MSADGTTEHPEHTGQVEAGGAGDQHGGHGITAYLRFAVMILTGMVVMYAVMFVGSWEWGHVRWSQSRVFMTLTMGGAMGLVMLAWMAHMYRNVRANTCVCANSLRRSAPRNGVRSPRWTGCSPTSAATGLPGPRPRRPTGRFRSSTSPLTARVRRGE